jgi:hypothetical protein
MGALGGIVWAFMGGARTVRRPKEDIGDAPENGQLGVGFSDATRDVFVARIVAWRQRSAQAGNRGVGLGGSFVAMGI